MARPPQFDARMSEAESLMWRLDKDPYLSSTVGNITVLDRRADYERFKRRLERASRLVPRLRQRVQPTPVSLTPPIWVDDPEFDIDYHVRHVALPKPGSLRQLCDLATLIVSDPFDRTRPLWEFFVVDGLKGGGGAIIQKLHHTVADGEGSIRLSMQFLDLTRDAEEPPMPPEPETSSEPVPPPTTGNTVRDLVTGSMRMPIGISRQFKDLLTDPTQIPAAGRVAGRHRAGGGQPALGHRGRTLDGVDQAVAAPPPGDAAGAAGGDEGGGQEAGRHPEHRVHHRVGRGGRRVPPQGRAPVDWLRASMAISTRTKESGSNAFSLARLLVPTGEMDMAERFALIHEATTTAREASATAGLETVAAVAATLPTSLVTRLARSQAQTVDFATSNVRAADFPCYIAGAQILSNYPIGPLLGVAFNLTLISYCGSLDMGLNVDAAAVEDPGLLRACIGGRLRRVAACRREASPRRRSGARRSS